MSYENRLERRTLGGQVSEDYQDAQDDSPIYGWITGAIAGVVGYKLFKSGAFSEVAGSLMRYANDLAEGGDLAAATMSTIKQWSKLKDVPIAELAKSGQNYLPPKNSIFRPRESTLWYDIFQDLQDFDMSAGFTSTKNFQTIRKIMADTQTDLHLLKQMTDENVRHLPNRRTDYTNTQLYQHIREIANMDKNLRHMDNARIRDFDANAFNRASMDNLLQHHTLTQEKARQQLKESGYRALTLGDVAEIVDGRLVSKQGAKIDLDSRTNQSYRSLLDEINDKSTKNAMFSSRGTLLANDNWQKLVVDSSIRINEQGDVLDFRMSVDNATAFVRSLSTDFKLPVVQFNPLKSIAGLDKLYRINPMYGYIGPNQFNALITGRAGQEYTVGQWLGDTFGKEFSDSYIGVINGNLFVSKPKFDEHGAQKGAELFKIGEGFRLHNITYADESSGLRAQHNAIRQMSGIKTNVGQERSTFKGSQNDKINTLYKYLDIGFEEWTPEQDDLFEAFDSRASIDEFQNKLFERARKLYTDAPRQGEMGGQAVNFKTMFGQGPGSYQFNGRDVQPHMYDVTKKAHSLFDVYKDVKAQDFAKAREDLHKFGHQFFAGQRWDGTMDDNVTEATGVAWSIFNTISEGLKTAGLGLSVDSKKSPWKLGASLLVKRALPLYMLTQVPEMINYFSEPLFGQDEDGNRGNITKALMNGVVKPIDLTAHKAMDLVGATKLVKFMQDMVPGSDQINELPVVYQLGLGQTAEERKDYIENGYDPVRKGRYWGAGNTPFTGGKIEYWRPNIYRRVQADVDFSDSKYGSRQEYYNNTWYPNLVNPLAPINHFILDRNHYDKKHYYDRPYLQTAPEGAQMPLFGPIFSQTIGRVINPPKKMHLEYWERGLQVNPVDELPSPLLAQGVLHPVMVEEEASGRQTIVDMNAYDQGKADRDAYITMQAEVARTFAMYQEGLIQSSYQAKEIISKSYIEKAGITFQETSFLPKRVYDTPFEVYTTPSGAMTVVDVPNELNLYNVNQDLRRWSLNKVIGANQRVTIDDINGPGVPVMGQSQEIDNAFLYGVQEQYNWLGEVAGLKGFALQQFVTGYGNERATQIEDSGYAYSFSNSFWDENLGGLGANMSEITRRFIPKRNKNTTYINPIRNTMPSWMPGSDYFTDFKHGDPYSKVMNGEERLPGEGYERLHGIKGLMDFNIGSSSIGYSQAYIVRHMLNQDVVDSGFEYDTLETGTQMHGQIQRAWVDAGIAFSTEGEIRDKRNGIIGYYDAMIHDPTSRTGVGIVDIKTTSAKKLDELRQSGQALEHHQRQVNYYLWATQNEDSRGYIYYVDKDNPMNTYTVGFDYSREMLKDTLNNVYAARKTIRNAVENGVIGRGELYDTIDQYRILADVAPYSQELKDVKAKLGHEMTGMQAAKRKAVEEEVSRIDARMSQQKEPLRVYDYKFKTSNLKTETVTVSKIIDNNTIVTREYGKKHAITFAGIHVSESNSELYDERRTMAKAAHDEIIKFVRPGQKIQISYDADERNKYSSDSTRSIRAVVQTRGANLNQRLLKAGVATEKPEDDSPAAIHARYSKGEIAFGSAMETLTHSVISKIPFVGTKLMQVRSPYESYRDREVYGKDFQSWNNPIRDILVPNVQQQVGNVNGTSFIGNVAQVAGAAFIGSMFGAKGNQFGKIVGAVLGGTTVLVGKGITGVISVTDGDSSKDWRPKRRRDQEELNEYVDTLKYVKNIRLYEQYKMKAKKEDHFDVEKFMRSKESEGVYNSIKQRELQDYKRKVKLDFKHRDRYNFKYGEPKYVEPEMSKKATISAINKELSELQSQRKVTKLPENAMKAIQFKRAADQTMYGYNPGDSLVDIMAALPKKDRQYFQHFMGAPEEEKEKILRIAPSYMRRALQSAWGKTVDKKPTLNEYFMTHGLPDANWIGWSEHTDMNDVKVKLVNQNNLDPGEFDIWDDNKEHADSVNIPIPQMRAANSARETQIRLQQLLGRNGYDNVQVSYMNGHFNNSNVVIKKDARDDVAAQIANMQV